MEGLVCGRYRITGKLGQGGMAEVYTATHDIIGREAAIKLLRPEMSAQHEVVRRFLQEAQATATVEHSGIAAIYDVGYLDDGRAYIVMERLHGETLNQRLKRVDRLSIDEAKSLMRQLAEIMHAAHAKNIIHRDLKPDNLFIVPDPEVTGGEKLKVLDFGLAKLTAELQGSLITTQGTVFGTPSYMAPEQCKDSGNVDERADLYSIGCIFYRCLCGQAPFVSADPLDILRAHISHAPEPPSRHRSDIPPDLDALIMQLLEKSPDARVQSCAELMSALDGNTFVEDAGSSADATLIDDDAPADMAAPGQELEVPDSGAVTKVVNKDAQLAMQAMRAQAQREAQAQEGPPRGGQHGGGAGGQPAWPGGDPARPMGPQGAGHQGQAGMNHPGPAAGPGVAPAGHPHGRSPWPAGQAGRHPGYRHASVPGQPTGKRRVWLVVACAVLVLVGISVAAWWTDAGGDPAQAAAPGADAAVEEPESVQQLEQAREALANREWDRALEALERAIGADADEAQVAELRAEAQRGKEQQALYEGLQEALAEGELDVILERLAEIPEQGPYSEDVARAVEEARDDLVDQATEHAEALARDGACHELAEWGEDLEPLMTRARPEDREEIEGLLARCGKRRGRARGATESKLSPEQIQSLVAKTKAAYSAGDYGRAYGLCRKILRADRSHADANLWCTLSACKQNKAARAKRHYPRLRGKYRGVVRQTCMKQGVELGKR